MKGSPEPIGRREFLKMAGMAGLSVAGLAACAPAAAPPTPTPTAKPGAAPPSPKAESAEEALAKLVDAAKKEGRISIYSSGSVEELEARTKVFQNKYPFIEFDMFTGTSEDIVEKAQTEAKAGRNQVDIVRTSGGSVVLLVDQGLNMKYKSPSVEGLPKDAFDPEGGWHYLEHSIHALAYNTKLIPASEAPKSFDDLADPRFKGKLGIEAECTEWFTQMKVIMGEAKFSDLARKIAANNPRPIKGHTTLARMVVSGEVPVAVVVYQYRVQLDKEKNAPVEWVFGSKPVTTSPIMVVIPKNAPHPNAAKLMVDWWLAKEGQEDDVIKVTKRFPVRAGLDLPDYLKGVQVFNPPMENNRLVAKAAPEFRQIFNIK